MTIYGKIIVIKRNGSDGSAFPLTSNTCLIGRDSQCDIRIQLATVSQQHSRIDIQSDGQVLLTNLSNLNPTTLNLHPVKTSVHVHHMDIITVADRSLRWEFPINSQYYTSPKQASPLKYGSLDSDSKTSSFPLKLSPEGKSPPLADHRSFKVSLGTPRPSPGKRSLQKPLSGKKVPFFLTPKPGKQSPKKLLPPKTRGFLAADPPSTDNDMEISPKLQQKADERPSFPKSAAKKLQSPKSRGSTSPAAEKSLDEMPKVPKKVTREAAGKTPSPKITSKITQSPASPVKIKRVSVKSPGCQVPSVKLTAKTSSAKASPKKSSSIDVSRMSLKSSKIANRSPRSLNKISLRRASVSGSVSPGMKRTLLRRSGPTPRSRKVSFGPNLSPEQFDRGLPPTTPLRKGGRPSRLSVANIVKRSISPSLGSPKAKKLRSQPSLVRERSTSPNKSPRKSSSGNQEITSPMKSQVTSLVIENAVKIHSPASPDSKKSAALRTIHAKLVLNKFGRKSGSLRKISPPATKRKTLGICESINSSTSDVSEMNDDPEWQQTSRRSTPQSRRGTLAIISTNTSFDVDALKTPKGPDEMFVSPMTVQQDVSPSFSLQRMISRSKSVRRSSRFKVKSPLSDYTNVEGVKRLMRSPQKSPKSDYTNVEGVKRLMRSQQKSPKSDYTDVFGLKRIFREHKSPLADYSKVKGLKRLMKTPEQAASGFTSVKEMTNTPKPDCGCKRKSAPVDNSEEKASLFPKKFYPKRQNKLEPVDYLGYVNVKSPGNSQSPSKLRKSKRTLGSVLMSLLPESTEDLEKPISSYSPTVKLADMSSAKKQLAKKRSSSLYLTETLLSSPATPGREAAAVKRSLALKLLAKKSPTPKRLSVIRSPALRLSSAKKSPVLKRLSADETPALKSSSAKKSPVATFSPAGDCPVLELHSSLTPAQSLSAIQSAIQRLSGSGSSGLRIVAKSPPSAQGRSSFGGMGAAKSRASLEPELSELYLPPDAVMRLTPTPSKTTPKIASPKTPPVQIPLPKTLPVQMLSPKTPPVQMPSEVSPSKSSGKRKLRSARSVKAPIKYSPRVRSTRKGSRALTPAISPAERRGRKGKISFNRKSPLKSEVDEMQDATLEKSPAQSPSSPPKRGRGKTNKVIDTISPSIVEVSEPKAKSVRKPRKASKIAETSPEKSPSVAFLTLISAKKTRGRMRGAAATPGGKKSKSSKAPKKSPENAHPATLGSSPKSSVKAPPDLPSKIDRGRKAKAKPLGTSPLRSAATTPPRMESLAENSLPPVAARRTRKPVGGVKASPKNAKLPAKRTRKASEKSAAASPLDVTKGKLLKRKAIAEESTSSKSPIIETLPTISPRRTRRGAAAKKGSPTKKSPVAPAKKDSVKTRSPGKAATAARSLRKTKK